MKGKYVINTLKDLTAPEDKKTGVTLICCFSRMIFVPFFFSALKKIKMPRKDIHLLIYDNTQDGLLQYELEKEIEKIQDKYKSVRLYKSYIKGRGSIAGSGNEQFDNSKLHNIWVMWKRLFVNKNTMIHTPTFFQLEDDTIAPPYCYEKLFKSLNKDPKIAMVTGISTGRNPYPWFPVRLGVHTAIIKGFKILERHSLDPYTKGIVDVDCCGVYTFAARTDLFIKGFKNYDPKKYNVPFFGLDNVLTWNIKKLGGRILADFDVWVSHLECAGTRIIAFSKEQAVEMVDVWVPKFHNYAQGIEILKKDHRNRRYRVRKHAQTWEL